MDIVDLYFSDEEFSVEREREIADEYARYCQMLEDAAERHFYELAVEI
jgi:hypothetical protein